MKLGPTVVKSNFKVSTNSPLSKHLTLNFQTNERYGIIHRVNVFAVVSHSIVKVCSVEHKLAMHTDVSKSRRVAQFLNCFEG